MQKQLQQPAVVNIVSTATIFTTAGEIQPMIKMLLRPKICGYIHYPRIVGLKIKVDEGNLIESILANSPSDGLDLKAGDRIQIANDQSIISVADLQWVLDSLPSESELHLEAKREGVMLKRTISLSDDWRKTDISWRASMWNLRPRVGIHVPEITVEEKKS